MRVNPGAYPAALLSVFTAYDLLSTAYFPSQPAFDILAIGVPEPASDRTRPSGRDRDVIDLDDGYHLARRSDQDHLVGGLQLGQGDVGADERDLERSHQAKDQLAGHSRQDDGPLRRALETTLPYPEHRGM